MPPGEPRQLGHARHACRRALMISQMTPAGVSPASRARSTAASVWPARTSTPPSRARSGNTWPGRSRSCGRRVRIDRRQHRRRAIGGRDAGAGLAARVDGHAHRRLAQRRVDRHLERDLERVEPLGRHRQADQAAAVRHHEVDDVRRDLLGGNREVAFVLAILVVDDDHHRGPRGWRRSPLRWARTGCDATPRDAGATALTRTHGNVRLSSWTWNRGRSDQRSRRARRTCRSRRIRD